MEIMNIMEIFALQRYVEINLGTAKVKVKLDNKNFPHATAYGEQHSIAKYDFLLIGWWLQILDLLIKEKQNSIGNIDIKTFLTRQNFMKIDTETGKFQLRLDDESYFDGFYKEGYFYISRIDFLIIGAYLNLLRQML